MEQWQLILTNNFFVKIVENDCLLTRENHRIFLKGVFAKASMHLLWWMSCCYDFNDACDVMLVRSG